MLILQLRMAKNIADPARLRDRTKEVLDRPERRAKDIGIEHVDIANVKFALVAFIDEAIIGVNFSQKDSWLANPLQMEIFGRNDAGVEVFRRLNELRQRPQIHAQVLEVYCLCLVLGYKGKYAYQDTEAIRGLIEDTKADLSRVRDGGSLSPVLSHIKKCEGPCEGLVT